MPVSQRQRQQRREAVARHILTWLQVAAIALSFAVVGKIYLEEAFRIPYQSCIDVRLPDIAELQTIPLP